jgi:hypothetical protein
VLTGGWQTDREGAYVALTRARDRTDLYLSREDLGEEGMDDGAIQRLSERIAVSRAQQASITQAEAPRPVPVARPGTSWQASITQVEGSRREGELSVAEDPLPPEQAGRRESLVGRILRERKALEAQRANERGRGRD